MFVSERVHANPIRYLLLSFSNVLLCINDSLLIAPFCFLTHCTFSYALSSNRYAVAALAEYRPLVLQLGEQDVCAAAVTSLVRWVLIRVQLLSIFYDSLRIV